MTMGFRKRGSPSSGDASKIIVEKDCSSQTSQKPKRKRLDDYLEDKKLREEFGDYDECLSENRNYFDDDQFVEFDRIQDMNDICK